METWTRWGSARRRLSLIGRLALTLLLLPIALAPRVADAAAPRTPVWIGAPLDGTWPTDADCAGARYPSAKCSLPFAHHTFRYGNPYPGDWSYDEQSVPAGAAVRLFAAPQDPNLGSAIGAKVESVGLACLPLAGESPAATRSRGGDAVRVGIYHGATRVGTVTFVHVNAQVSAGQGIGRWGSQIGTVGSFAPGKCWDGVHLHVELYNDANYACYNRTWAPRQQMYATNFIGFLGGSFASSPRQPCP